MFRLTESENDERRSCLSATAASSKHSSDQSVRETAQEGRDFQILALVGFLFVSGVSFGALFEQRRFAPALELTRLCASACALVVLVGVQGGERGLAAVGSAVCVLSAAAFVWTLARAKQTRPTQPS